MTNSVECWTNGEISDPKFGLSTSQLMMKFKAERDKRRKNALAKRCESSGLSERSSMSINTDSVNLNQSVGEPSFTDLRTRPITILDDDLNVMITEADENDEINSPLKPKSGLHHAPREDPSVPEAIKELGNQELDVVNHRVNTQVSTDNSSQLPEIRELKKV